MTGIPTMYKHVQFRSRVEARWAAFFDLVGWGWDYEPFDLNGYIPDFSLRFATPLIVEVKSDGAEIEPAKSKIECSGWTGDALVVAGAWPDAQWGGSMPTIGWLSERDQEDKFWWDHAVMFECLTCRGLSVFHHGGRWNCRACADYDGDHHISPCEMIDPHAAWARAGNIVQWRRAG